MREVDALVVGGGPVGLTASILLSRFGISSLLVEARAELRRVLRCVLSLG